MLSRVDATLVTSQQKLRLFRDAVCPRLTWDLSISDLPNSWVEKNLDVMTTRFLKRWTGLARSADTSRLYLPKSLGGLQLPSPSTLYKKLQCAKAATLMSSRDPLVRHLTTWDTLAEASAQRKSFKPYQQVVEATRADPGANRKATAALAKEMVVERDTQTRLDHCRNLPVQGQTARQFQDRAAVVSSSACSTRPCHEVRFKLSDGHPATQLQPQPLEKDANTRMPVMPRQTDPSPHPKPLQCGSAEAPVQQEARRHSHVIVLFCLQSPSPWPPSDSRSA